MVLGHLKEFIGFYAENAKEIFDLNGLDRNFSLTLPFRRVDLPFDSPVSSIFASYFLCFAKFQFILSNIPCFHSIVIRLEKYRKIAREIREFYFKRCARRPAYFETIHRAFV